MPNFPKDVTQSERSVSCGALRSSSEPTTCIIYIAERGSPHYLAMPSKKAALPTFEKKKATANFTKDMQGGSKSRGHHHGVDLDKTWEKHHHSRYVTTQFGHRIQEDKHQSAIFMDTMVELDTTSDVPLLEQLRDALNDGKVVARVLDIFREWDTDKVIPPKYRRVDIALDVLPNPLIFPLYAHMPRRPTRMLVCTARVCSRGPSLAPSLRGRWASWACRTSVWSRSSSTRWMRSEAQRACNQHVLE